MTTWTKFGLKGRDRDSHLELILAFPLSSIRSEEHLDEAQKVMDKLLAKGKLDDGEQTYLLAFMKMRITRSNQHRTLTCFGIYWKPRP